MTCSATLRVLTLIFSLIASSLPATAIAVEKENQPNILLMMVDNVGWGELGCYGGGILRGAETPRLDKLADEGLRLLNFNVEPQCTPSRSALMTGRHPIRSGTTKVVWGMEYGLTSWEITIAEALSNEGYATGMFGKWHLGDSPGRYPVDQGFDEWYGIPNTTDESLYASHPQFDGELEPAPQVMSGRKGKGVKKVKAYDVPARRLIDAELTNRTIDFMKRQAENERPFFAYVPFTQAHLPTLPHPDFEGRTSHGPYADVLAEIDFRAGQLLDAIDELNLKENTIVIWTSDNGPEELAGWQGTAGPWRGHYFTALEGSLRTSFIIRWPGQVPAGEKSNEIVHMVDLFPTLCRVAECKVPEDRLIDGVDQTDFLLGKQPHSNREGFPVYNGDRLFAYKWRNWKMHFIELNSMLGTPRPLNMPHLHNLISDPKEEYNLINMDQSAGWVMPVISKKIIEFKSTFEQEPPIKLGESK